MLLLTFETEMVEPTAIPAAFAETGVGKTKPSGGIVFARGSDGERGGGGTRGFLKFLTVS